MNFCCSILNPLLEDKKKIGGLNWTVQNTESRRSRVKVDGPKRLKVDGLRKWTVQKNNWKVQRKETRRSLGMKVDGSKGSKWTVLKMYTVPNFKTEAYRIKT